MVTKSTQTQHGGKCDGQFHKKRGPKKGKKQKGYTTEHFMPGNAVIMLIFFRLKELIVQQKLSPTKNKPCRFFFLLFLKCQKTGSVGRH